MIVDKLEPMPQEEGQISLFDEGRMIRWNFRRALTQKYHVVCTNPPYMGASGMNSGLSDYLKKYFPDSKNDLFACFIEHWNQMALKNGFNCMVTMQSWMFLSSFEKMRIKILQNYNISTLMHMENMVMGIAFGTAVAVFQNNHVSGYKGTYHHIKLEDIEDDKPKKFPVLDNRFAQVSTDDFKKIPGSPVAYWVSEKALKAFLAPAFSERFFSGGRNKTHNNEKYVRSWWEIQDKIKWKLYSNGGEYRKWYGNNLDVVDWSEAARNVYESHGGLIQERFWDIPAITWNDITSGKSSYRVKPIESKYSSVSPTIISKNLEYDYTMLAFLNSVVCMWMNQITNPTLHTLVGNVLALPDKTSELDVSEKVKIAISISKADWDSFETSLDFQRHPLV